MTMVAQLVWVVALAGVSLFVTTGHFDKKDMKKPDWLDHVNTYNLKLKLAFAIISISGVHALKTYLSGGLDFESMQIVVMVAVIHFMFVLSAIGISYAERLTRESHCGATRDQTDEVAVCRVTLRSPDLHFTDLQCTACVATIHWQNRALALCVPAQAATK